jgi:hypothetical protein
MLSQQVSVPRSLSEPSQFDAQPSASQTVEVTNAAPVLQTEGGVVSASVLISAELLRPRVPEPLCQATGLQLLTLRTGLRPSLSIQLAISFSAKMLA